MIFRPVRPVSALGPPISNRPVGLTRMRFELAQHRVDHLGADVGRQERLDVDLLAMLGADQHGVDPLGGRPLVRDRDLALAVRPQVGDHPRLAHVGQPLGEPVRHRDRQRHQLVGLAAGVPEHHPLVPGAEHVELVDRSTLAMLERLVDAPCDVGRLFLDRRDHPAGVAVDPEVGVGVPDLGDRPPHDRGDLDVLRRRDLAGDHDQPRRHQRLARDAAPGVHREDGVQDRVGDPVGELVGVPLGDRFG